VWINRGTQRGLGCAWVKVALWSALRPFGHGGQRTGWMGGPIDRWWAVAIGMGGLRSIYLENSKLEVDVVEGG
jgi:hypothetical protein